MKPIPGFDNAFATEQGCIVQMGKLRAQYRMPSGYMLVNLRIAANKRKTCLAHRLVCLAYHGQQPVNRPQVRHLDGDPGNNRPENLAWGTHTENMRDRDRHGATAKGEQQAKSILSAVDVVKLRFAVSNGMTTKDAALLFGISQAQASHVATGHAWKSAGGPITRRKAFTIRDRS